MNDVTLNAEHAELAEPSARDLCGLPVASAFRRTVAGRLKPAATTVWIGVRDSYILNMKTSSTNPTTPNATNDVSPIGKNSPTCLAIV